MASIVSFTRSKEPGTGTGPEAFVDDGELLEFPQAAKIPIAHPPTDSLSASDKTNQELADIYRAHVLIQAAQPGLDANRGISDEGDPWFLIGKPNGDVLVHICRIQGTYIFDSVSLPNVLRGQNFISLVENFFATVTEGKEERIGSANVVRLDLGGTICLHPSMMIAALVKTLLQDAGELTLPLTAEFDDTGQGKTMPNVYLAPNRASKETSNCGGDLEDSGENSAFLQNPRERGMLSQRDEMLPPFIAPSYSHALATVAISAGVYASFGSIEALWKFTHNFVGTTTSIEQVKTNETDYIGASLDLLPKALTYLGNLVDLGLFDSFDDQTIETDVTQDHSKPLLAVEGSVVRALQTSEEMLINSNEIMNRLTYLSFAKNTKSPGELIDTLSDQEVYPSLQDTLVERNPENTLSTPR